MDLKKAWEDCLLISKALGCSKMDVYTYLYRQLTDSNLIEEAKKGKHEAINHLPGYGRIFTDYISDEAKLKIAFWYIRKMGGVEKALEVMKIAASTLIKLRRNGSQDQGTRSDQDRPGQSGRTVPGTPGRYPERTKSGPGQSESLTNRSGPANPGHSQGDGI